MRYKLRLSRCR